MHDGIEPPSGVDTGLDMYEVAHGVHRPSCLFRFQLTSRSNDWEDILPPSTRRRRQSGPPCGPGHEPCKRENLGSHEYTTSARRIHAPPGLPPLGLSTEAHSGLDGINIGQSRRAEERLGVLCSLDITRPPIPWALWDSRCTEARSITIRPFHLLADLVYVRTAKMLPFLLHGPSGWIRLTLEDVLKDFMLGNCTEHGPSLRGGPSCLRDSS